MDDQGNVLTHITALDKRMTDGFEAINARLSDQAQAVHGRLDVWASGSQPWRRG